MLLLLIIFAYIVLSIKIYNEHFTALYSINLRLLGKVRFEQNCHLWWNVKEMISPVSCGEWWSVLPLYAWILIYRSFHYFINDRNMIERYLGSKKKWIHQIQGGGNASCIWLLVLSYLNLSIFWIFSTYIFFWDEWIKKYNHNLRFVVIPYLLPLCFFGKAYNTQVELFSWAFLRFVEDAGTTNKGFRIPATENTE